MNAVSLPLRAEQGAAIVNGLSVDVEDWFQVGAFENVIERDSWDGLATRVEDNVLRVLDLFAEADVKDTFFTLGWVAQRNGPLMRRIVEAGHELASHGYDHARVFTFERKQFAEDILRARKTIEDAGGVAVTGYRAPSWKFDSMRSSSSASMLRFCDSSTTSMHRRPSRASACRNASIAPSAAALS